MPGTGAYHHSMASAYNLVGRAPLVGVREGVARVLVRRESTADLLARDCCLPRSVPDAGSRDGCWDDDAWCGGVVLGRD